jgi:hypothetical protein
MAGTHGDFASVASNGWDMAKQIDTVNYQHMYKQNALMPQNVGVRWVAPGLQAPQLALTGFVQRGQGVLLGA